MSERDRHGPRWSGQRVLRGPAVVALVAAAGLSGSPSWADRARRAGKDVRITRVFDASRSAIKFCVIPGENAPGECFSGAPAVGATGLIFDTDGQQLGVIRADAVELSSEPCNGAATFTFSFIRDSVARPAPQVEFALVVFGIESTQGQARFQFLADSPDGIPAIPDSSTSFTVDLDSNDEPDVAITRYECTDVQPPARSAGPGPYVDAVCTDYWRNQPRLGWQRVGRDIAYRCN